MNMKHFKKLIPNIFILTEGKTEEIYLNHLKERGCNYSVHIQVFGGSNPVKMVKRCNGIFRSKSMSYTRGDYAFCVMDVDNCKREDFEEAIRYANKNKIRIIVSNPCFEVFFLLHFVDVIPNITSKEMKKEISKYFPNYRETGDYWKKLLDKQKEALERSRKFKFDLDVIENELLGSNIYEIFDVVETLKMGK